MTPREIMMKALEEATRREFDARMRSTLPGGLDIRDLRAAAQTDEEPFPLVTRLGTQIGCPRCDAIRPSMCQCPLDDEECRYCRSFDCRCP